MSSSCAISSGKHLICELCHIQNTELLNSMPDIRDLIDNICSQYSFTILGKLEHQFTPQGCSLVYLLSESHISVHTFPEKNYIAMDIYTCREYPDNSVYQSLYEYLVRVFRARMDYPIIIDRGASGETEEESTHSPTRMNSFTYEDESSPANT